MSSPNDATPRRRTRSVAWFIAVAGLACGFNGNASVAVYVGKNLTKDGGVILAGFGDEPSSHWLSIVPRRQHAAGATITAGGTPAAAMPGELITIPQVHETFRYIAMEYSYYRGLPAPLINGGLNEYGVAVRDVALSSRRELVEMNPKVQHGVNYSDIARISLERAHSAREAVDISIALLEKYGDFTYGGNSHVFADSNEGWVLLEFAGGKGLWVAHRLGPNDVWLNWRGYNKVGYVQDLPSDLGKNPDFLTSKNFVSFAIEQGWYRPADGQPFNVIKVYSGEPRESSAVEVRHVVDAVNAAAPKVEVQVLMQVLHEMGGDSSGYGRVADLHANVDSRSAYALGSAGAADHRGLRTLAAGCPRAVPPEYRMHRYLTAGEAERTIDHAQQGVEASRYADGAVKETAVPGGRT